MAAKSGDEQGIMGQMMQPVFMEVETVRKSRGTCRAIK
jgi:hypothetical protein